MAFYYFNAEMKYKEPPTVPPFATATDVEITETLDRYYNGVFSLQDIQEVWHVGDKRSIPISAMTATEVTEAHHADNYEYEIIDFNHDLLVTPINGINNALLTVVQDRIFYKNTTATTDTTENVADEYGYMHNTASNSVGWNGCKRRTWCNSVYKAALPQYIQNNIKQVYKSTANAGNTNTPTWIANTDYCFLLSEFEVFGSSDSSTKQSAENGQSATHYINGTTGTTITMAKGGTQYPYFTVTGNKCKLPAVSGSVNSRWWERSPCKSGNATYYCVVGKATAQGALAANSAHGIAPAFAM